MKGAGCEPEKVVVLAVARAAGAVAPTERDCFFILAAIEQAAHAADRNALELALAGVCQLSEAAADADASAESQARLGMVKAFAWLALKRSQDRAGNDDAITTHAPT